jgi:creatinine amidohydrolase/Fe(II)-dependent formamide hydrolase-like protein
MAQHHLGFPGTISLRPSTFIAAIRDWVMSLAGHGFDRLYFLNGHGGNVASIEAAFSEIYAEASFARRPAGVAMKLRNWWELPGVMGLCSQLFPTGHGGHATPSEIAVTQFAYPDRVKTAAYEPSIAPTGPIREAQDFRAAIRTAAWARIPRRLRRRRAVRSSRRRGGLISEVESFARLGGHHRAVANRHRPGSSARPSQGPATHIPSSGRNNAPCPVQSRRTPSRVSRRASFMASGQPACGQRSR